MRSNINALHKKLIDQQVTIIDLINASKQCQDQTKTTNSMVYDNYVSALEQAHNLQNHVDVNNLLYGIPYSLKDNVCTKGITTTGGSKFLENFVPPYNATVYELLQKQHAIMVSKSNLDEFGMGGTGLYSFNGKVTNFYDSSRIAGGSSSGAVNQVASGAVTFAIGTDTGDSTRHPASFLGIVGYKPSYGLISRYGVLPYAPSLDHMGIFSNYLADVAIVASAIIKFDLQDYTSQQLENTNFYNNLKTIKQIKFIVFDNIEDFLSNEVKAPYQQLLKTLMDAGHLVQKVTINPLILKALRSVYMIISYAEGCSCYANMTGIAFGLNEGGKSFEEIIFKNRTKGLGAQVKRRLTLGAYITQAKHFESIFQRSKKIRTLIINEINRIIQQGDCFLCPAASSIAPKINDVINNKAPVTIADDILLFANFAGLPSVTVPYTRIDKMPWGVNVNCKQFDDQHALNIALTLEELFRYA